MREGVTGGLISREHVADTGKMVWQPIETAPTNISILIFMPGYEHYGPGVLRAIHVDMGTGKRWHTTAYACGSDIRHHYHLPTHWMHLPSAPEDRS